MLLSTLYWPDEIRALGELDLPEEEAEIKPAEKKMAAQLIEAMTGEFDPAEYRDEYREALMQVIESKIEGRETVEIESRRGADQARRPHGRAPGERQRRDVVARDEGQARLRGRGQGEARRREGARPRPSEGRRTRKPEERPGPTSEERLAWRSRRRIHRVGADDRQRLPRRGRR